MGRVTIGCPRRQTAIAWSAANKTTVAKFAEHFKQSPDRLAGDRRVIDVTKIIVGKSKDQRPRCMQGRPRHYRSSWLPEIRPRGCARPAFPLLLAPRRLAARPKSARRSTGGVTRPARPLVGS